MLNPKVDLAFKELPKINTIKKAMEVLEHMSLTTEERDAYEARLGWLMAEELALEKAEKKGREEGLEEGLEKGKLVEKKEIIKNGLKNKIPLETLSLLTNLTTEDIKKIIETL